MVITPDDRKKKENTTPVLISEGQSVRKRTAAGYYETRATVHPSSLGPIFFPFPVRDAVS